MIGSRLCRVLDAAVTVLAIAFVVAWIEVEVRVFKHKPDWFRPGPFAP